MAKKVMILSVLLHLRKTSHPVRHHFEPSALLDHPTGLSTYISLARGAKSIIKTRRAAKASFTPQHCSTHCHVQAILTWFQKCHGNQEGQYPNAAGLVAVRSLSMRRSTNEERQSIKKIKRQEMKHLTTLKSKTNETSS